MAAGTERRRDGATGEQRAIRLDLRASGEDGTFEGYGSVFGVEDTYSDVIAPGAFAASLAQHRSKGTMPAMLWQHDPAEPIGVWSDMTEDEKGLKVKGRLAIDTVRGREAQALLKMGALNGLSIGFVSVRWSWDERDEIRTLEEIDLWEVSLVTFPANRDARVTGVKTVAEVDLIGTIEDAEKALREAGFSKSGAKAFLARVQRFGEARREAADALTKASAAAERLLQKLTV